MQVEDPVGVLVLRLWMERDDLRLRARITSTIDVEFRKPTVTVATGVSQIGDAVARFVADFTAAEGAERPATPS